MFRADTPILRAHRRYHCSLIELGAHPICAHVLYLDKYNEPRRANWCGFIGAAEARTFIGARSVRLLISKIESDDASDPRQRFGGYLLERTQYVHGCLVERNAWAIVERHMRVIDGPERPAGL